MFTRFSVRCLVVFGAVVTLASVATAQGVPDEFTSGEDSRYTRHDPLAAFGAPGTWSFPPGAYRMQGDPSPDPAILGVQRVFSTRNLFGSNLFGPDGRFTMGVNVVDWNPGVRTSIGMFTNLSDVGVGTTDTYFTHIDVGGGGPSALVFDRIVDDHVTARISQAIPELTPDHDYSIVLAPSLTGPFWVFLYDTADVVNPIAYFPLQDSDPLDSGLLGFGTTGISDTDPDVFINSPVDATFDHFVALPAPATGGLAFFALAFASRRRRA